MERRREALREGNKRNGAACEVRQAEKLSGTLLLKTARSCANFFLVFFLFPDLILSFETGAQFLSGWFMGLVLRVEGGNRWAWAGEWV